MASARLRGHDLFRLGAAMACLLCYTTILLGGNVMASGNGLACPDWPSCFGNGNFLPAFQGGVIAEWSHRVSAFFLSVTVLVTTLLGIAYERSRRVLLRLSFGALGLVVTEALFGGLVVESGLDPTYILIHLGLATALFGLLLVLALLANLREMPRRWVDWARRASTELPRRAPDLAATPPPAPAIPDSPFREPGDG
jgi:heme A synthase